MEDFTRAYPGTAKPPRKLIIAERATVRKANT